MTTVAFLLDSVLAVGWIALAILAAGVALVPFVAGCWAGTAVAARYQGRRLARYCELYVRYPGARAALDTNYQPRKEKP